jgi:hypothetical protein
MMPILAKYLVLGKFLLTKTVRGVMQSVKKAQLIVRAAMLIAKKD